MVSRFPELHVRDRLLHEDPVNFAARIAGKKPTDLVQTEYIDFLKQFNDQVRPEFTKRAAEDYNTNVKPAFDKLMYSG